MDNVASGVSIIWPHKHLQHSFLIVPSIQNSQCVLQAPRFLCEIRVLWFLVHVGSLWANTYLIQLSVLPKTLHRYLINMFCFSSIISGFQTVVGHVKYENGAVFETFQKYGKYMFSNTIKVSWCLHTVVLTWLTTSVSIFHVRIACIAFKCGCIIKTKPTHIHNHNWESKFGITYHTICVAIFFCYV